jgi:HPt (histidine-containing phosphotransfer) domain-containing protein
VPNEDSLDWVQAMQAVNGDAELLEDVLEAALDEFPKLLTEIHGAVAKGDAAALKLAAHSLKGTVRFFGENPVYTHAYRLEQMGRDDRMDGAEEALADLEKAVRQLTPLLQKYVHVEDG